MSHQCTKMTTLPTLHPFIFNWPGQVETCLRIESALRPAFPNLTVINSDERNERPQWINIGNDAYYTAQFLAALSLMAGEIIFFMQADAFHPKILAIVREAQRVMADRSVGIYAPNVDRTDYRYPKANLTHYRKTCWEVPNPDNTCWAVRKSILQSMVVPTADENKLGWGICAATCAYARSMNLRIVRDFRWTVKHKEGRNYSESSAISEMTAYFEKLPPDQRAALSKIREEAHTLSASRPFHVRVKRWLRRHVFRRAA